MDARLLGILASASSQGVVIDDYLFKFDFSPTMPDSEVLVGDKYDVSNGYSALVNTDNGITVVDEGGGNAYLARASVGNVNFGVAETGLNAPLEALKNDTQGTLSFWCKTSTANKNWLISLSNNNSSATFLLFGIGHFRSTFSATDNFVNFTTTNLVLDQWQQHTFKTDSNAFLRYFIDDVEQSIESQTGTNVLDETRNWMGDLPTPNAMHAGYLHRSSGSAPASLEIYEMDAISYYQRELSDAEILALYAAGR